MSGFLARFRDFPAALRWTLLSILAALVVTLVGAGLWSWRGRQEARAQSAFGAVLPTVQQGLSSGQAAELESAATALRDFLGAHSGSSAAQQAWFLLGQVELQRRQWDPAVAAFLQASGRGRGSIATLSRLGEGAALEAKGEPARAVESYQQGLAGRGPQDFLYGELLLAKARAQEGAKDSPGAIATYKQYLKDLPESDRGLDVRIRLALLGEAA